MWAHMINAILGIWLIAAPGVLGYGPPMAVNERIVGPLVAAFATMAMWEVLRPLRRITLVLGVWMVLAPWVLSASWPITWHATAVGLAVAGLSLVRGRRKQSYGGGWSVLWQNDPYGLKRQRHT